MNEPFDSPPVVALFALIFVVVVSVISYHSSSHSRAAFGLYTSAFLSLIIALGIILSLCLPAIYGTVSITKIDRWDALEVLILFVEMCAAAFIALLCLAVGSSRSGRNNKESGKRSGKQFSRVPS